VVHGRSSGSSGYPLTLDTGADLPTVYVTPEKSPNLLAWLPVFRGATEIHVAHSSVFWLIDRMRDQLNAELYYHSIRRTNFDIEYGDLVHPDSPWKFVDYPEKV
jgi:hypothetical protein